MEEELLGFYKHYVFWFFMENFIDINEVIP